MNDSPLQRVSDILSEALHRPVGEQREAYLDATCGSNSQLRRAVEAQLAQDAMTEQHELPLPTFVGWAWDLSEDPNDVVGRRVGPYEIRKRIGHGGMGYVFLAVRHSGFHQQVAIKLARPGGESSEILRRFRDEIQFQAALGKHSHISALLDAGWTDDGQPYFVMEHVDGVRIDDYCDVARRTNWRKLLVSRRSCGQVMLSSAGKRSRRVAAKR